MNPRPLVGHAGFPPPFAAPSRRPRAGWQARGTRAGVLAAALCSATPFLAEGAAWAQASTGDRVAAESLFTDARRLMQAGDYEHACPKLEASRKLEPGLGTTLNLGDCYEKLGRTASAWAEFRSAAAEAQKKGDAVRKSTASERAAALEPRLSRLQIDVADPSVTVFRNGEALSAAVLGSAIVVDPGSYRLEARAPGKATWAQTLLVSGEGAVVQVSIPRLPDLTLTTEPRAPVAPGPTPSGGEGSDPTRTIAWVVGGVGVASVAVGATFGLLASSSWSKAEDGCEDLPYACSADALQHEADARTRANVATAAFIVGAAALGTSVVLWVASSGEPAAELAIGPASVTLEGRF